MKASPRTRWRGGRGPQKSLDLRARNRDGTLRKKRGPKPDPRRRDPHHVSRPEISARYPVHVVLRTRPEVGNLRRWHAYRAIRRAIALCSARHDYRVVHASIQSNHLHLLVEADDKRALARGMQGFAICAAKRLNRELRRAGGEVFPFRYHATPVTNPTQARNAIAYILNNWRRHRADLHAPFRIDPFSSGFAFHGWRDAHDEAPRTVPLPVVRATSWLLTDGWKRAGPIDTHEIPGPDPIP
ncbi:MAG TPA: transposase [Kofleriaceae bacterium]|jgi:REP element-mobilizing transposase RayT|nr:transposase [Kofleriaceae bacterium]